MLVSINELKKYVDLANLNGDEIANGLTFAGIEVEEVNKVASGTNLIIGHILECEKHPDSDHLHILKVDLGSKYGIEQIVCGAPNARVGLNVIVARVGAKLPDGEIKPSAIRGVSSNGMCCSLLELGVDSKYLSEKQTSGIEELPNDAPVGEENVLGYLGLDDEVLNLKILANRPDLLSLYNVAKEVGAIFDRKVEIPAYEVKDDFVTELKVGSETWRCSQFSGREINDIKVGPSPKWMQETLMAMGVRSINNIVDIGNYVMLLTGQPLHMYDADKLAKKELIARNDLTCDFVALDEKTYKVIPNDMVITCDGKAMCLGGVMGSLECAVDENSKNIVIESASFDGATIRHTSNRLGLASESSSRFVKGTNHFQYENVLAFASELCFELCGAEKASNIVSYIAEKYVQGVIETSVERINGRLGTSFSEEQIKDVLARLNFELKDEGNNKFKVFVPQYRLDICTDADISEEVIRLLGFENVKSILPTLDTKVGNLTVPQQRLRNIRYFLLSRGVDECVTYSLISKKEFGRFNLLNNEEPYVLLNPITDEHELFRTHILHSLLKVATFNVARQNRDLALFETSRMQSKESTSTNLSIVLVGKDYRRGMMESTPYDFYHMKGLVEGIFKTLGIDSSRYKFDRYVSDKGELHPGKSATVSFQGKVVGVFGELHPDMIAAYDLGKTNCVVLEMNLLSLMEAKITTLRMNPISKFPFVSRDLAFVVKTDVEAKDIIKTIRVCGKGIVRDVNIFDVYQGEHIDSDKKSVAVCIIYGKDDGTLTDKEVSEAEDKIKFELTKAYHAELRM